MPTQRAGNFAVLWLAGLLGLCCLRAAGEPTLAFRLLADDPSTFDLLEEPDWHDWLQWVVGTEYVHREPADSEDPTCDWCLEELMVSSRSRE
jgi:hypothetical protein